MRFCFSELVSHFLKDYFFSDLLVLVKDLLKLDQTVFAFTEDVDSKLPDNCSV